MANPDVPVRLRLPAVDVKAPVDPVGEDSNGNQQVPDNKNRTGWWKYGVKVGAQQGNAVIDGHNYHDGTGVFSDLPAVQVGDEAIVTTESGTRLKYVATRKLTVPQGLFGQIKDEVYAVEGLHQLVLVTCDGWDGSTHEDTTIVFFKFVGEQGG